MIDMHMAIEIAVNLGSFLVFALRLESRLTRVETLVGVLIKGKE
jgi:hypothetical protein